MTDSKQDDVLAWLRDAHAMEAATVDNLERLIGLADGYDQLQEQLKKHAGVSQRQKEDLEQQLEELGADPSTLKDWTMKAGGWLEPLFSRFAADSVPKNCLAAFAYENFEIASYRCLLGAAEELDMPELRTLCERAIGEEREMADFLYEHMPAIAKDYLRSREPIGA